MCETQFLLLLLLQSTLLIVAWCNLVGVAFGDDDTKVFDRRICCDGGHRQTSFITGAMALMWWWRIAIGAVNFTMGALAPSRLSKVVARSPIVARGLLLPCTAYAALRPFVVRGSSSSCTTYVASCPCGKRLIIAFFDKCSFLGVLVILALGGVHTVFGVLACCLWCTHCTQPWHTCAADHRVAWYSCHHILHTQHESLIVVWELFCSSLAFFIYELPWEWELIPE